MIEGVATNLIVFGRGLEIDGQDIRLTRAAEARVDAAVQYVAEHVDVFREQRGVIVFSGGFAGASEGVVPPPVVFREGNMMLKRGRAARVQGQPLSNFVDLQAEIESDSTLENALRVYESGYFDNVHFSARNPLGLVAHADHLPRIDYLVRKVFRLDHSAVRHILATTEDHQASGIPEPIMYALTRLACFGVRTPSALRKREGLLKRGAAWLRKIRSARKR